jgi:hypothetical protein
MPHHECCKKSAENKPMTTGDAGCRHGNRQNIPTCGNLNLEKNKGYPTG